MMNRTRFDWVRWGIFLLLIVAGWFHYESMLRHTIILIKDPIEDMSHAWAVPFIVLYVIWKQRGDFRRLAGIPSWRGFGWVFLFLAVAWFGARGGQARIAQVSMIGLIWSVPYALWGREIGRLMLFPAWFFLFTIPVYSFLDVFTVHLRIFSSGMATGILNGFGMAVERSGTAIFSRIPGGEFNVDVADPCSGIRSLFAIMSLMAAYAYLILKTRFQRWTLFACSIPVAIIGNMFRIFSICLIARYFSQETATGFYHDYSVFVIFGIAVWLMQDIAKRLVKLDAWLQKKKLMPQWLSGQPEQEEPADPRTNPKHAIIITCLVGGMVVLTFQSSRMLGAPTYDEISFIADELPEHLAGYSSDRPWFCHDDQCHTSENEHALASKGLQDGDGFKCAACGKPMHKISLGEKRDLPSDTTIVKRTYRSVSGGESYTVSVVISGRSRGSIHRPELCLPAQGFVMESVGTYPLHVLGGKPHQARIIHAQHSSSLHAQALSREAALGLNIVQSSSSSSQKFSLAYWFISRQHENTSHVQRTLIDIWDRSIHNRINRWSMVAINASPSLDTKESMSAFESFLGEFYPQIFRDGNTP